MYLQEQQQLDNYEKQSITTAMDMVVKKSSATIEANDEVTMRSLYSYPGISQRSIDRIVIEKMKHLKAICNQQEDYYVHKMLIENPVVIERRVMPITLSDSASSNPSKYRAEACRRSRHNNKVKKVKMQLRHKYMAGQLMKSQAMLKSLKAIVAQLESELITRGFNPYQLENLRSVFRVNDITTSDETRSDIDI
ncbi:protein sisterless A [Glossina fuscipes]|uniref:Protein sisterless A n=1 Tax=Glossina fuscipes TaxID=7396 RepID=A0A9C5ZQG4_9MUSC|nr:protein sisterless A [Glossina fuscipes]KAI9589266.1 hypothetical protein GQX74_007435 [Glossina fuscipes]